MPIDPRIALGVQPSTFDPAAVMQNALAIRNARLQEQANQLGLQQKQQAMQEEMGLRNFLAQNPNLNTPEAQNQLVSQFGSKGLEVLNTQQELTNRRLQQQQFQSALDKAGRENVADALSTSRDMYANVIARHGDNLNSEEALKDFIEVSRAAYNDPHLGGLLKTTGANLANTITKGQTALESGTLGDLIKSSALSAEDIRKQITAEPKYFDQNLGATTQVISVNPATGKATVVPGSVATVTASPNAPKTTVVMPPTELAEKKAWGEQLVKDYSEGIKPAADQARKNLATVDVLQNVLDKGLQTGWGTELEGQARNALTKMGVEGAADIAKDIQLFKAFVRQNVLQEQMKQKGVQTEGDAQRIEETFARLGNTTEANKFLIDVRRVQLNRDIAQQKFWFDWKSKHGTFDGAEEAWINGEGSKSIFDAPTLKKYTETKPVTPPPAATTVARPKNVPANWTLEVDAKGNKAYVSPDRKQHVEVK